MQNTNNNADFTQNELSTILELVKHEQLHYMDSDDDTDVAVYTQLDSIINKIYNCN